MSSNTYLTTLAALAALGLAVSAQSASAQARSSDPQVVQTTISATGFDLDTPSGAKALLHRIKMRANDICGADRLPQSVQVLSGDTAEIRACAKDFVDTAVASFHSPQLAALNSSGRAPVMVAANHH